MNALLHAHPLLTVLVFTYLVMVVFVCAVFAGADVEPEIQQGGDWQWPDREET